MSKNCNLLEPFANSQRLFSHERNCSASHGRYTRRVYLLLRKFHESFSDIRGRRQEILGERSPPFFHCFKVFKLRVDVLIQTSMPKICTILPVDWYVPRLPFHLFIHPYHRGRFSVVCDWFRDATSEIEPLVQLPTPRIFSRFPFENYIACSICSLRPFYAIYGRMELKFEFDRLIFWSIANHLGTIFIAFIYFIVIYITFPNF